MAKSRKIQIRRVLTSTPLARQHELRLEKDRRRPVIPWASFRRTSYPKAALDLAFNAQLALAAGEYGAVDLFARIASAMALGGAPFDLVAEASRIVNDEIRHADTATAWRSCAVTERPSPRSIPRVSSASRSCPSRWKISISS